MKTIFTCLWCSMLLHSVAAQTPPVADTCLPQFRLSLAHVSNCEITKDASSPFQIQMTLLGKSLTDGFRFNWLPNQMNGHYSTAIFAKNGTVTPIAGVFQACQGNWVYFKASGYRKSTQNTSSVEPLRDISIRVRYWGNIQNPDSLRMEFASETGRLAYATTRKDTVCDKCLATDKMPPQITGCPATLVELPIPSDPTKVNGNEVMKQVGIKITDNCGVYNATNYPYLTSVTNGQIIDYKTIAFDQSGNRSVCLFKVKFSTPVVVDTCLTQFTLTGHPVFLTLLGKKIQDGFYWEIHKTRKGTTGLSVFGKNGTKIPPAGIPFTNAPGNWWYFNASGWNTSNEELKDYHARIRAFGNEHNPDSIYFEVVHFDGTIYNKGFYRSTKKTVVCNACLAADRIAPVIQNCPTKIVSITDNPSVHWVIAHPDSTHIKVTDNCSLPSVHTYPTRSFGVANGQVVDYQTIAYDDAGNKSTCKFKVQFKAASCSAYANQTQLHAITPMDNIVVSAPAGQNCKAVTWYEPQVYGYTGFNPLKQVSSNFASGHCFPIGTTRVVYTAKDSCGGVNTAGFNVTVLPYNTTLPRLSADNQIVTLDIKSLSPDPTDGALLVRLKSIVDKDVIFDFYNAVGSKVYSQTQQVQHGENELFFDVTKLANGIYFIRTSEQDEKVPLTKFVKH